MCGGDATVDGRPSSVATAASTARLKALQIYLNCLNYLLTESLRQLQLQQQQVRRPYYTHVRLPQSYHCKRSHTLSFVLSFVDTVAVMANVSRKKGGWLPYTYRNP